MLHDEIMRHAHTNDAIPSRLRVCIVFHDFLLRDLLLALLHERNHVEVVSTCHISAYTIELVEESDPEVIIVDRPTAANMMELFDVAARKGRRIRVVAVSLKQNDFFIIDVDGRRQVEVEELLDAVVGKNQPMTDQATGQ